MKDNGNNLYNPNADKIGFQKQYITIPNDTIFEVELFKETLPFKAFKPSQAAKSRMLIGYEGKGKEAKVMVKNGSEIVPSLVTQMPEKDSLQIWFKPIKVDSLQVNVQRDKYNADFTVKIKAQKADTLSIRPDFTGSIPLRERYAMTSSTPLVKFDKSKISIRSKDSTSVDFTTEYDEFKQKFYLDFKKEPLENYKIQAMPGAMTDFFEKENDTLNFKVTTKNLSDYANLRVVLENVNRFPLIVELTDKDGKVKYTEYTESTTTINFDAIEPSKYTLRVIYDDNKNKVWDTGNFLEKRQAEEVIYLSGEIDVRPNWDWIQPFNLGG
jgi:hypothetical protein